MKNDMFGEGFRFLSGRTVIGAQVSDHEPIINGEVMTFNIMTKMRSGNNGFSLTENPSNYHTRLTKLAAVIVEAIKNSESSSNPINIICLQEVPSDPNDRKIFLDALREALRSVELLTQYPIDDTLFRKNGTNTFGQFCIYNAERYVAQEISDEVNPLLKRQSDYIQGIRLYDKGNPSRIMHEIANVHLEYDTDGNKNPGTLTDISTLLSRGMTVIGDFNRSTPHFCGQSSIQSNAAASFAPSNSSRSRGGPRSVDAIIRSKYRPNLSNVAAAAGAAGPTLPTRATPASRAAAAPSRSAAAVTASPSRSTATSGPDSAAAAAVYPPRKSESPTRATDTSVVTGTLRREQLMDAVRKANFFRNQRASLEIQNLVKFEPPGTFFLGLPGKDKADWDFTLFVGKLEKYESRYHIRVTEDGYEVETISESPDHIPKSKHPTLDLVLNAVEATNPVTLEDDAPSQSATADAVPQDRHPELYDYDDEPNASRSAAAARSSRGVRASSVTRMADPTPIASSTRVAPVDPMRAIPAVTPTPTPVPAAEAVAAPALAANGRDNSEHDHKHRSANPDDDRPTASEIEEVSQFLNEWLIRDSEEKIQPTEKWVEVTLENNEFTLQFAYPNSINKGYHESIRDRMNQTFGKNLVGTVNNYGNLNLAIVGANINRILELARVARAAAPATSSQPRTPVAAHPSPDVRASSDNAAAAAVTRMGEGETQQDQVLELNDEQKELSSLLNRWMVKEGYLTPDQEEDWVFTVDKNGKLILVCRYNDKEKQTEIIAKMNKEFRVNLVEEFEGEGEDRSAIQGMGIAANNIVEMLHNARAAAFGRSADTPAPERSTAAAPSRPSATPAPQRSTAAASSHSSAPPERSAAAATQPTGVRTDTDAAAAVHSSPKSESPTRTADTGAAVGTSIVMPMNLTLYRARPQEGDNSHQPRVGIKFPNQTARDNFINYCQRHDFPFPLNFFSTGKDGDVLYINPIDSSDSNRLGAYVTKDGQLSINFGNTRLRNWFLNITGLNVEHGTIPSNTSWINFHRKVLPAEWQEKGPSIQTVVPDFISVEVVKGKGDALQLAVHFPTAEAKNKFRADILNYANTKGKKAEMEKILRDTDSSNTLFIASSAGPGIPGVYKSKGEQVAINLINNDILYFFGQRLNIEYPVIVDDKVAHDTLDFRRYVLSPTGGSITLIGRVTPIIEPRRESIKKGEKIEDKREPHQHRLFNKVLVDVFKETKAYAESKLNKEITAKMMNETKMYNTNENGGLEDVTDVTNKTKVDTDKEKTERVETNYQCFDVDSFSAAKVLLARNPSAKPLVLNMAHSANIGGGVEIGTGAQEEDLFRCSNYYQAAYQPKFSREWRGEDSGINRNRRQYVHPIPPNGSLYTPHIQVFRDRTTHAFIPPFTVSAVAVAGRDLREAKESEFNEQNFIDETKSKIKHMLEVALANGHDTLVLGALGCGAFLPQWDRDGVYIPRLVAKAYKEILQLPQYQGRFKNITFAVLPQQNSNNYEIFNEMIETLKRENATPVSDTRSAAAAPSQPTGARTDTGAAAAPARQPRSKKDVVADFRSRIAKMAEKHYQDYVKWAEEWKDAAHLQGHCDTLENYKKSMTAAVKQFEAKPRIEDAQIRHNEEGGITLSVPSSSSSTPKQIMTTKYDAVNKEVEINLSLESTDAEIFSSFMLNKGFSPLKLEEPCELKFAMKLYEAAKIFGMEVELTATHITELGNPDNVELKKLYVSLNEKAVVDQLQKLKVNRDLGDPLPKDFEPHPPSPSSKTMLRSSRRPNSTN